MKKSMVLIILVVCFCFGVKADTDTLLQKVSQSIFLVTDDVNNVMGNAWCVAPHLVETNANLIHDIHDIRKRPLIVDSNRIRHLGEVVFTDDAEDVSFVKISGECSPLPLNVADPKIGEEYFSFPLRGGNHHQPVFISTVIKGRYLGEFPIHETISFLFDMLSLRQGDGGTPIVDSNGKVVGVIFARLNIQAQDFILVEPASSIKKLLLLFQKHQ